LIFSSRVAVDSGQRSDRFDTFEIYLRLKLAIAWCQAGHTGTFSLPC